MDITFSRPRGAEFIPLCPGGVPQADKLVPVYADRDLIGYASGIRLEGDAVICDLTVDGREVGLGILRGREYLNIPIRAMDLCDQVNALEGK